LDKVPRLILPGLPLAFDNERINMKSTPKIILCVAAIGLCLFNVTRILCDLPGQNGQANVEKSKAHSSESEAGSISIDANTSLDKYSNDELIHCMHLLTNMAVRISRADPEDDNERESLIRSYIDTLSPKEKILLLSVLQGSSLSGDRVANARSYFTLEHQGSDAPVITRALNRSMDNTEKKEYKRTNSAMLSLLQEHLSKKKHSISFIVDACFATNNTWFRTSKEDEGKLYEKLLCILDDAESNEEVYKAVFQAALCASISCHKMPSLLQKCVSADNLWVAQRSSFWLAKFGNKAYLKKWVELSWKLYGKYSANTKIADYSGTPFWKGTLSNLLADLIVDAPRFQKKSLQLQWLSENIDNLAWDKGIKKYRIIVPENSP